LLDVRLGALKPNLDPDQLAKSPGTVKDIDLQLEWHRQFDPHIPKKSVLKRKAEMLDALIVAVNYLNNGEVKIAEAEEEMSGNGGETDEDVDGEDPGLE
jgi:4'-phosphopantetheinyl transferase EntD